MKMFLMAMMTMTLSAHVFAESEMVCESLLLMPGYARSNPNTINERIKTLEKSGNVEVKHLNVSTATISEKNVHETRCVILKY